MCKTTSLKISIIVPIYNVEKYLVKCVDSIVKQTYSNIEIILVDDESPDGCPKICDIYAENDQRVRVIHKNNAGLSAARNSGMRESTGKYIMFVDADDWIEENTCETLIELMTLHDSDVVMFSYIREYKNKSLSKKIYKKDLIVFDGEGCKDLHRRHVGAINKELSKPENFDALCSANTKLYKSYLIKSNMLEFFDNSKLGTYEDGVFNMEYFEFVRKAVFTSDNFYHYRKTNENSIVSSYNPNLPTQWNMLFDHITSYIKKRKMSSAYYEALNNRISFSIIGLGLNSISSDKNLWEKFNEIRSILKNERYVQAISRLNVAHMPIHWKLFFLSAKYRVYPSVFLFLYAINFLRRIF
jgi:glycosyltransferase involved in cell wall biosynthesis